MTKTEQAKACALAKCRLGNWQGEREFANGMVWLAEHSPETQLAPRQKWYLDALLWRYRKQLAGRAAGFDLPTCNPREESYFPKQRRQPAQASLL